MTKRFEIMVGGTAWDNLQDKELTPDENIDLLNKLFDENEQLKQEYQKLQHRHSLLHDECLDAECERDSLKKDVNSLEKENEQLKQQLETYDKGCHEIYNDKCKLEKENEELKQSINRMRKKHCDEVRNLIEENVSLDNELTKENEQLKQRINSRLHFYRELYDSTNDDIVKRVVEDLEDILKE